MKQCTSVESPVILCILDGDRASELRNAKTHLSNFVVVVPKEAWLTLTQ